MSRITLSQRQSELWQNLEAHQLTRLADLRARLESVNTEPDKRLELVYRIDELKKFLSFGDEPEKSR